MNGSNLSHGDRTASQIGGPCSSSMILQRLLGTDSAVTAFHDSRCVVDDHPAGDYTPQFCVNE